MKIFAIISILSGIIAVVWALVAHRNLFKNYHYICLKCSNSYKPATFLQSVLGLNAFDQRRLKCPHCNKKEWAKVVKNDT